MSAKVTIGRAQTCDWTVDDVYASPLHCSIYQDTHGVLWLRDEGTTNGTFLNESRVWADVPIRSGDRIRVGRTTLTVP